MKKLIAFVWTLLLVATITCGCGNKSSDNSTKSTNNDIPQNSITKEDVPAVASYHCDWPHYKTTSELVDFVDEVFEGKITNISFAVMDIKTGEPVSESSQKENACLYTIYEIEVTQIYKGSNAETKYIAIMGGIDGYQEQTQVDVMKESGLIERYDCIPLLDEFTSIQAENTYLFLACDLGLQHLRIPNPEQFAFSSNADSSAMDNNSPNYFEITTYAIAQEQS